MALRSFGRAEGGNFSMLFAMILPALLGGVALAVDVATLTQAHSELQNAADAAVLAASRINDKTLSRDEIFQDYLSANLLGASQIGNVDGNIEIETGINYISTTGTVTAEVTLHLGFMFGSSRNITVTSSAYESRNNLEVVMALDNTGSMGSYNMSQLRKAATSLVDILEGVHSPDTEPKRIVKAALVPFVTAVNIKRDGDKSWENWIDSKWDEKSKSWKPRGSKFAKYNGKYFTGSSDATNHLALFRALEVEWKGCVEARPAPYNLTDAAPSILDPDTLFVPYFAPDNPGQNKTSPNNGSSWNNSYLNDSYGSKDQAGVKTVSRYKKGTARTISENSSRTTGPNYACPTPIMPLTSDFDKLRTEIGKMIYWEGSGTNVSEGMAWAYRVLSPGEPYTQGDAFKSEFTSKYAIVFTDGENTVFGASSQPYNKSDYGSYHFLDQGRFGTTNRNNALTQVNDWTLSACKALKDDKVEVFTVLLGADTQANRNLYTKCATTPDHYYPTSNVEDLDGVFKKIASRIAKLYVTN